MKDYIDFEGKSVELAVEKACHELNVSKDQLAYDIISYGSTGIFGLVRTKKALIRVQAPQASNSKTQTQDRTEAVPETQIADEAESGSAEKTGSASDNFGRDNRSAINALLDETFGEIAPVEEKEAEEAEQAAEESSAIAEEPDEEGEETPEEEPHKEADEGEDEEQESAEHAAPASEEAIAVAREMLSRILAVLSPGAEVSVHQDPDLCRIHINGGETAVLIGRKGQTLEAMQYLVDKAINKQCGKGYRIVVDVEGYLETRRNELKETATRLAEKAQKSGKPTTMNRMNAHDRRIVHLALKNNKAVRTQSVGDGYYRKLMILPKRRKRGSKTRSRSRQSQQ